MKSKAILIIALLFSFQLIAQTNGINYKAIVKDASGNILVSAGVTVEFNILGPGQSLIYNEEHVTTTDANGLIVLNIGQGTSSYVFGNIQWGSFQHFLNVKMNTGAGFVNLGTTPFEAVPYALQAENSNSSVVAETSYALRLRAGTVNQFYISYGAAGDKLQISEVGISGNVLEINNGELRLPQYAGAADANLKIDANGKLFKEVVLPVGPQATKINRYAFTQKEIFSDYTKYYYGIQFKDGTILSGIKAYIMDNDTSGSFGVNNTAYVGIYRSSKTVNSAPNGILPIYRIDGSDTPTNQFNEFTQTTLAQTGANIIDNTNYIYFFQIWHCNTCLVSEATVLH